MHMKNGGLSVAASLIDLHQVRAQTDKMSEGAHECMYRDRDRI